MFNLFKWLWGTPEVQYKIVEVKAPRNAQKWSKETKDAVSTLQYHPGFIAVMERFELHRQMLISKLATEFHKDQREADYIQAGVYWLGYGQALVSGAGAAPTRSVVDPMQEELEAFRAIDETIERIGMEPPQAGSN
jgi:hypothetical protein